jgi:hypothetical protein
MNKVAGVLSFANRSRCLDYLLQYSYLGKLSWRLINGQWLCLGLSVCIDPNKVSSISNATVSLKNLPVTQQKWQNQIKFRIVSLHLEVLKKNCIFSSLVNDSTVETIHSQDINQYYLRDICVNKQGEECEGGRFNDVNVKGSRLVGECMLLSISKNCSMQQKPRFLDSTLNVKKYHSFSKISMETVASTCWWWNIF